MADTKVSALAAVATPAGTDEIPVNQAGASKKLTLTQVKTFSFPWTELVKGSNQDVTNSVTLTSDSALTFAVTSGDVVLMQLMLAYQASDATTDFRCNFAFPTTSATGWLRYIGDSTAADAINVSTGIRFGGASAFAADIILGTPGAIGTSRTFFLEAMFRVSATGNVTFQFANSVAGAGLISRVVAGSVLRYRKLA